MRKIYLFVAIVTLGMIACKKQSFLDDKTSNLVDVNAVFSDSARTIAFLNRMYEEMPFVFLYDRWEGGNTIIGTDDAESNLGNPARRSVALYLANYSQENFPFHDAWNTPWVNIRRANLLLSRVEGTPLSQALKRRLTGEAKFMRAYFYTYLASCFGGIPIVGDSLFDQESNINLPRASYDESVKYIVKELDEATALLPAPNATNDPAYDLNRDYGRVTKGACMALKARLLLYAASPLFNGGAIADATEEQKKVAGYPTYSAARWQAAADAAKAVIDAGYYSLWEKNSVKPGFGFYEVFLKRVNTEYILFANRPQNKDWESAWLPGSRGGGARLKPTQNLVECFPMKNGKAITDPTSGYDPANPYFNRDPRFNYSIIFNGSRYQRANTGQDTVFTYSLKTTPTNIANTTGDGFNPDGAPPATPNTGYFCRKMCDSTIAANSSPNTERGWPLIRYAEIILCYAEALNELGQTELAVDQIKLIRNRAGIDAGADSRFGIIPGISQVEMRELIRNERHIELFAEGDNRWDDIRRWKIAEAVNNGLLKGIWIERNPTTKAYTYKPALGYQAHVFKPRQYLFPIPGIELRKMPLMIQNPGW
jgi:starch-binding outer membrane protein, SusD/RagB family